MDTSRCLLSLVCTLLVCLTMTSATSETDLDTGTIPRELHLADLSLPPEVIMEALFTQVDLTQDQLEQCEELVRNNLKGDSTAELPDDDEDEEDEEDDEETMDEEIARLAVNAFEDFSSVSDLTTKLGPRDSSRGDGDSLAAASPPHADVEDQEDDVNQGAMNEEGIDAAEDEEDDSKEGHAVDQGKTEVMTNTSNTALDTSSSDADEIELSQGDVVDVDIDQNSKINEMADAGNVVSSGDVSEDSVHDFTTTTVTTINTETTTSGPGQDHSTPEAEPEVTPEQQGGSVPQDSVEESGPLKDNSSERSRRKRSLTLPQILMNNVVEGGRANPQKDVSHVTSGKGRIRRSIAQPEDVLSLLMKQRRKSGEETPSLAELEEELRVQEFTVQASEGAGSRVNMESNRLMETDLFNTFRSRHTNQMDMKKTEHSEKEAAVPRPNSQKESFGRLDNIIQIAEKFIHAQNLPVSLRTLQRSPENLEVQRLLATVRNPSRAERRRVRRSCCTGMKPDRYVPLIGQLVDRLKYIQHSLAVCHRLLPPDHTTDVIPQA